MSFPHIPDINPCISITFEDAINLLLTSVAMEEMSLSRLIDAETEKICYVIGDCRCKDPSVQNAILVNRSVRDTIKNMIKLQMLLQFKLDNIKEIIEATCVTTTCTYTSTTTTCTYTTMNPCCAGCSTPDCDPCDDSLMGNCSGRVSNCGDEFYGMPAELYLNVNCCEPDGTMRYFAGDCDNNLQICASGSDIDCEDELRYSHDFVVCGKGYLEKHQKCEPDTSGIAEFKLTLRCKPGCVSSFRMEIFSPCQTDRIHDSGFVDLDGSLSDIKIL